MGVGYIGGGKSVLSALSAVTPDKNIWRDAAGNVEVETYGLHTPAGFAVFARDDLNVNSLGSYTLTLGNGFAFSGTTFQSQGPDGAAGSTYYRTSDWGTASDTARMRAKMRVTGSGAKMGVGFEKTSNGFYFLVEIRGDAHIWVRYNAASANISNGSDGEDLGALSGFAFSTYYVLELTRAANNRTVTIYAADGTTVLFTDTRAILAGQQAAFGSGVTLNPGGLSLGRAFAGGSDSEVDWVEYQTQQAERHDLIVAVTPTSGGTRQTKRIAGSLGASNTLVSDFVQPADLVPYAPLASPTFTGTPSLPTGTTGVTQADADSSTKLASTAYADRVGQQVFGINTQTGTSYTAVLADAGKVIESNNASAMTLTIPPNASVAYPVGTRLRGVRLGAGTLTLTQGASVVLRNRIEAAGTTNRTVSAQYGAWEAYKRATNEWVLTGDIA